MKIAMLTNNYKPYIGGVPISIEHLAEELRKLGHEVYIFAPSYKNQKEEPFVIRYPSFPVGIAGAPVPNVLTGLFRQKMKELQIDLIHVHHPAIVGNVALSLRRQLGLPVVFTYHTRYEEYLHYIKLLEQTERHTGVIDAYLRYFCSQCDMIFAPTPGICDHLLYEKTVEPPVEILPTGLPADSFSPEMPEAERIREKYLGGADYLFCTVARLAKEKNLDFLLESLQKLKEELAFSGKSFRHLMIGDGPERKHLEEACSRLGIEQEVIFLGNVENKQIKNYHAACDLFLFTSKSETQGIVVLEAMAAGNPVVAVDATGVRDVVRPKENGMLTPEDAERFARAAEQALCSPGLYESLRKGAEQTAAEYAESRVARRAERHYLQVLNSCQNQRIHAILRLNLKNSRIGV